MMTAAAVGSTPPARTSNARTSTPRRRASRSMAHDCSRPRYDPASPRRSEEHTSELQSLRHLVCRLLLEKKKKINRNRTHTIGRKDRQRVAGDGNPGSIRRGDCAVFNQILTSAPRTDDHHATRVSLDRKV